MNSSDRPCRQIQRLKGTQSKMEVLKKIKSILILINLHNLYNLLPDLFIKIRNWFQA